MGNTTERRLLIGVAVAAMSLLPQTQALSLSQTCNGTLQTFASTAAAGTTTDGAQPFSFTVPAGVTSVLIDAAGAQGGVGTQNAGDTGGQGAEVASNVTVAPGNVLCFVSGVAGGTGANGGGGGGSFVFKTSSTCTFAQATLANLLVAAGGGGGGVGLVATPGSPGLATGLAAGAAGATNGGTSPNGGGQAEPAATADRSLLMAAARAAAY